MNITDEFWFSYYYGEHRTWNFKVIFLFNILFPDPPPLGPSGSHDVNRAAILTVAAQMPCQLRDKWDRHVTSVL